MHVRFFTPWSTLAAHIDSSETEKRMVIEMAQQSYLPKKVQYIVNGSENSLDSLAQSFGVTKRDLCRWNHQPVFRSRPGQLPGVLQAELRKRTGTPGKVPATGLHSPNTWNSNGFAAFRGGAFEGYRYFSRRS